MNKRRKDTFDDRCSVVLPSGKIVQHRLVQINLDLCVEHEGDFLTVTRDRVVGGRQTYKAVISK